MGLPYAHVRGAKEEILKATDAPDEGNREDKPDDTELTKKQIF